MSFVIDHPADLVNGLAGENGKEMAKSAVEEMKALAEELTKTMDRGVAPAEFERLTKIRDGLMTAATVVAFNFLADSPPPT
ncbi:MAG: hypothetical protein AAF416_16795 [Pseudomonadota bacterium]